MGNWSSTENYSDNGRNITNNRNGNIISNKYNTYSETINWHEQLSSTSSDIYNFDSKYGSYNNKYKSMANDAQYLVTKLNIKNNYETESELNLENIFYNNDQFIKQGGGKNKKNDSSSSSSSSLSSSSDSDNVDFDDLSPDNKKTKKDKFNKKHNKPKHDKPKHDKPKHDKPEYESTESSMKGLKYNYDSSSAHTGGEFSEMSSENKNMTHSGWPKTKNELKSESDNDSSDVKRYTINTSDINMISE